MGGIVATTVMTLFMYLFHWFKLANGDMVRALGSFIIKREEGSFLPGLVIHMVGGIIFAFLYLWMWTLFPMEAPGHYIYLGAIFGFFHGLAVSFMLVIVVAEHHPLERFRRVGFAVALVHLVAHVVYGVTLGAFVGQFFT
jgi:hypothetical protein